MATRASRVFSPDLRIPAFSLRRRWPEFLTIIVLVECIAAAMFARSYGVAAQIPWTIYYLIWLVPVGGIAILTVILWLGKLIRAGEQRPLSTTVGKLRSISFRSYVEFFVPVIVMAPFMASFTTLKTIFGDVTTYHVDPMLFRIDGALGFQPWQVTHALIGPLGTTVIDGVYFVWIMLVQVMLFAILFLPQLRKQRGQVLLTFVICWILLGTFLAIAMPSVGPCYYGKLYQPDVYAELMQRLQDINQTHPVSALRVQDALWLKHSENVVAVGSGISAMPSMHVSIATIIALLLRRLRLAWIGWPFLALIFIGSVHLGWHYAVDGIVAVVGTLAIWKVISKLLRQQPHTHHETGRVYAAAA